MPDIPDVSQLYDRALAAAPVATVFLAIGAGVALGVAHLEASSQVLREEGQGQNREYG